MELEYNEIEDEKDIEKLNEYQSLYQEIENHALEIEKQKTEKTKKELENEILLNYGIYFIPKNKFNTIHKAISSIKGIFTDQSEKKKIKKELQNSTDPFDKIILLAFNTDTNFDLFIDEMRANKINLQEVFDQVIQTNSYSKIFSDLNEEEKLSIYVYTSSTLKEKSGKAVYSHVNKILREDNLEEIINYKILISTLCKAIFKLSHEWKTAYRGLKLRKHEIKEYKKGEFILWKSFTSASSILDIAKYFATYSFLNEKKPKPIQENSISVIFKIDFARAPMIDQFSKFKYEQEILFPAFTCFEITKVSSDLTKEPILIELREIGCENNNDKKLLVWVDPNFENNRSIIKILEREQNIQLKTLSSTDGAVNYLNKNIHLISYDLNKLRIITNMVRVENGKVNFEAGLEFISYLRSINYNNTVLIYCSEYTESKLKQNFDFETRFNKIIVESNERNCKNWALFREF